MDGHDFRVRARAGEPGVYDIEWLSGPREYGFTCASSDRSAPDLPDLERAIRSFLAQVDPATGYID